MTQDRLIVWRLILIGQETAREDKLRGFNR